jgi:hypothetical protein
VQETYPGFSLLGPTQYLARPTDIPGPKRSLSLLAGDRKWQGR